MEPEENQNTLSTEEVSNDPITLSDRENEAQLLKKTLASEQRNSIRNNVHHFGGGRQDFGL